MNVCPLWLLFWRRRYLLFELRPEGVSRCVAAPQNDKNGGSMRSGEKRASRCVAAKGAALRNSEGERNVQQVNVCHSEGAKRPKES